MTLYASNTEGYNLTGNASGICPECGTPIPDQAKEKLTANPPKQ